LLIYDEARGHSEPARQIYGERLPQRILPNARTFVNVVQHLRNFGRFERNKRDLDRQRQDRILVAEEDILTKSVILINVWVGIVENHLVGPYVLPRRLGIKI
jgi:hypothetical protein